MDKKILLSSLWIFVIFNYLYSDLIGLMDASLLRQYLTGKAEGMEIDDRFLLYAAILMEIPISMVLLSRILPKNQMTGPMASPHSSKLSLCS